MSIATPASQPWIARRHQQDPAVPEQRTEFSIDRDRILHSRAFRRLQHKTQVFVVTESDFFRTRLTHTLEVAQICRGICYELGLDETLGEAISLAHDLGHTPFGHAGEEVLNRLMADYGGWNSNEHSLTVVDELESPYPHYRGVNLTWATREGIARHTTRFDEPSTLSEFRRYPQAGPEAQACSEADEIAYVAHDVEDAVNARFLDLESLKTEGPETWKDAMVQTELACQRNPRPDLGSDRNRVVLRRATSLVIHTLLRDVVDTTRERIRTVGLADSHGVRSCPQRVVRASDAGAQRRYQISEFMLERVYQHPAVLRQVERGTMVIERLFRAFLDKPELLTRSTQEKLEAPDADRARVVARFVAGMTDRFALDLYAELFEPGHRVMLGLTD